MEMILRSRALLIWFGAFVFFWPISPSRSTEREVWLRGGRGVDSVWFITFKFLRAFCTFSLHSSWVLRFWGDTGAFSIGRFRGGQLNTESSWEIIFWRAAKAVLEAGSIPPALFSTIWRSDIAREAKLAARARPNFSGFCTDSRRRFGEGISG